VGIVDIVHRAGEVMKLRTRLATLLQLALQPTQDMIKCQPALPRGTDVPTVYPAHPSKTLGLHSWSPTGCPLRSERETPGSIRLRGSAAADSRPKKGK
jgi:hypothetical protein